MRLAEWASAGRGLEGIVAFALAIGLAIISLAAVSLKKKRREETRKEKRMEVIHYFVDQGTIALRTFLPVDIDKTASAPYFPLRKFFKSEGLQIDEGHYHPFKGWRPVSLPDGHTVTWDWVQDYYRIQMKHVSLLENKLLISILIDPESETLFHAVDYVYKDVENQTGGETDAMLMSWKQTNDDR